MTLAPPARTLQVLLHRLLFLLPSIAVAPLMLIVLRIRLLRLILFRLVFLFVHGFCSLPQDQRCNLSAFTR